MFTAAELEKKLAGKSSHEPAAGGKCTACHQPHGSANAKLATRLGPDLCYGCHAKQKEAWAAAKECLCFSSGKCRSRSSSRSP